MKYIVEGFGDVGNSKYNRGEKYLPKRAFETLDDALVWLKEWATRKRSDYEDNDGEVGYHVLDCEDDRVVVWEVMDTGHRKVVWHFSGWHWDDEEFGLPQGAFPGDTESVYAINMKEY